MDFVCNVCNGRVPTICKPGSIIVHGAREHNLKGICFEIPKGKLVVLTGPSGSGKTTIATDILQKECVRQYLESLGMTTDHIEKAKVECITGLSPSIGISQRITDFNPRSTVGTKTGILALIRAMFVALAHRPCDGCGHDVVQPLHGGHKLIVLEHTVESDTSSTKKTKKSYFACPNCSKQVEKLEIAHFSVNTSEGACPACKGAGEIVEINFSRLLDEKKRLSDGGIMCWDRATAHYYEGVILAASRYYGFSFDPEVPIEQYTGQQRNFLLYGIHSPDFLRAYKNIKAPQRAREGNFEGVATILLNLYRKNPATKNYVEKRPCAVCDATGLASPGRGAAVGGKLLGELMQLSLNNLLTWLHTDLEKLLSAKELAIFATLSGTLKDRISNLIEVGLGYVTLGRTLPSLSAGEAQRLRLASVLGGGLTGVLYVLDEPTTGLHPSETGKLLGILRRIRDAGNTVLVIEHDIDLIKSADYIIDMGPGGGSEGGCIVDAGTPVDLIASPKSIIGKYLLEKPSLKCKSATRPARGALTIRGACAYNLKSVTVSIPVNQFVVVTGASGSGKSTFVFDVLDKILRMHLYHTAGSLPRFDSIEGLSFFKRVVTVDQAVIGHTKTSRSLVATYTKLFDLIREFFASLPEAQSRGFGPEHFSFNTSDKRCENCNGAGIVEIDMAFMPAVEVECPVCRGGAVL